MNMKKQQMKRYGLAKIPTWVVLILLMSMLVAACGGAPKPAEQPTAQPPANTPVPTEQKEASLPTTTPAASDKPTERSVTSTETPTITPSATIEAATHGKAPLKTPTLEFGVVPHLYYTDHERVLQLTQNAGFDWVRQQIVWKDMELEQVNAQGSKYVWDQLDPIVEAVNKYKIKLLISIVQSPSFYNPDNGLPPDPATLGNFVEAIAKRYGDKVHAYEIWNEQNLAHETGGRIVPEDAGHYVDILMESYTRIKAINPKAFVLAGAPSSTGYTDPSIALSDLEYYKAMYTYKHGIIRDYFDVQAVHPGGSANPPDTLYPDNPSKAKGWTDDSTFYFRHIEHVRKVMEEYGMDDHQIWITEYGWATKNTTPGYEFGNQISFQQQSDYITGAIERTYKNYPWVGNMFLWNINFAVTWKEHLDQLKAKTNRTPYENELISMYWNDADPAQPLHEQASFGILHGDWTPRPSYHAIQALMAKIKSEQHR